MTRDVQFSSFLLEAANGQSVFSHTQSKPEAGKGREEIVDEEDDERAQLSINELLSNLVYVLKFSLGGAPHPSIENDIAIHLWLAQWY